MATEPNNEIIEPEDSEPVKSNVPLSATPEIPVTNDAEAEVPVPVAMEPAEIDERARVIEALNRSEELP